jgi:hypothetical protein
MTALLREEIEMVKRMMLGLAGAVLMAPVMYAGAYPFTPPPTNTPWEKLSEAAAYALCKYFDLCFATLP